MSVKYEDFWAYHEDCRESYENHHHLQTGGMESLAEGRDASLDGLCVYHCEEYPGIGISIDGHQPPHPVKPYHLEPVLVKVFEDWNMTPKQAGEVLKATAGTVREYANQFGVEIGNGTMWKRDREWDEMCKVVRDLDGQCVVCGVGCEEYWEENGRKMPVHHVIPKDVFENQKEANFLENLVSLCPVCHGSVEESEVTPRKLFIENEEDG